jgi:type I restriction enzyme, S subunit
MASVMTSQHEIVSLESVSEKIDYGLTTSATLSDTGIKFLRITDIQENGVDWQSVPFCECSEKDFNQYSLARGDLVFARTGATTGKSFLIKDTPEKTVFASYLIRVRANQKLVDPEFLSYFFQTSQYWQQISDTAVGAAQVGVNGSKLAELKLPLPPLHEQKRIASLLARVDHIHRLRKTAHDLSDTLLQSVFLEMFGDVVRNEKGWEKAAISDLGKVQTGNTPSREEPENFGDFIEWIKSDNIRDEQLYVSPSREKLSELGLKKGRTVDAGAVLITCIAGSLDHIGDTSLTDRTVAFNQQINAVSPFDDVNPLFLRTMLHIAKPYVQYNASAGMKHIITKSKLEELVLVKPSLSLQEEFAGVVARVESLRGRMGESTRQAGQSHLNWQRRGL